MAGLINCTVRSGFHTNVEDGGDEGSDADVVGLSGPIWFVPVFEDRRPIPVPSLNSLLRPKVFSGWFDNGVLRSKKGGTEGVRIWANDPVLNLQRLTYDIRSQLVAPDGVAMPLKWTRFEAPDTDTNIFLSNLLPRPGSKTMGIVRVEEKPYLEDIIDLGAAGAEIARSATKAEILAYLGAMSLEELEDLIAGAPGTLDTLNELAAAIGDDPEFYTTVGARTLYGASPGLTDAEAPLVSRINRYNCAAGSRVVALPALAGLKVGAVMALEKDTLDLSSNSILFTCAGADTFDDGRLGYMLRGRGESVTLIATQIGLNRYWKVAHRHTVRPPRNIVASFRPSHGLVDDVTVDLNAGHSAAATFYSWATVNRWRVYGGVLATFDANHGVNVCTGVADVHAAFSIEFLSNATDLRVHFTSEGVSDFWIMIDDRRVAADDLDILAADVADGDVTVTITPAGTAVHKYRVGLPATSFRGVSTNAAAVLIPSGPAQFRVAMIGGTEIFGGVLVDDALGTGDDATISAEYPPGQVEQRTGVEVWRLAVPGTGYVAEGAADNAGPFASPERLGALEALPNLDAIVVWASGSEDLAAAGDDPNTVVTAARAAWTAINAAQPAVPLIVVSPWHETDALITTNSTRNILNTRLKRAALAHPGVSEWIDLWTDPPFVGTGRWGSPANNGAADIALTPAGDELTVHGARMVGEILARKLAELTIPSTDYPKVLVLASGAGSSFFDSFDRAALGADYALTGAVEMVDNDYVRGTGAAPAVLSYNVETFDTAGQYAEIRVRKLFAGGVRLAIMSTSGMTSYVAVEIYNQGLIPDNLKIVTGTSPTAVTERRRRLLYLREDDVIGLGYEPGTKTYTVYRNGEVMTAWRDANNIVPTGAANRYARLVLNIDSGVLGFRGCGVDNLRGHDWVATA